MLLDIIIIALAYLLGSVNSAIIVCKAFNLPDPRTNGSNNPGATNVLRLGNKYHAAAVLIGDMLKGFIPALIAGLLGLSPFVIGVTVLAAVLGHIFPLYYEFKGGKGVATAIGGYLGISFILGILAIAIWIIVAKVWRYSSLASLCAIAFALVYSLLFFHGGILPILAITIIIFYKHAANIQRLRDGTESKISDKLEIFK